MLWLDSLWWPEVSGLFGAHVLEAWLATVANFLGKPSDHCISKQKFLSVCEFPSKFGRFPKDPTSSYTLLKEPLLSEFPSHYSRLWDGPVHFARFVQLPTFGLVANFCWGDPGATGKKSVLQKQFAISNFKPFLESDLCLLLCFSLSFSLSLCVSLSFSFFFLFLCLCVSVFFCFYWFRPS